MTNSLNEQDYRKFFKNLVENPPYEYQVEVARLLYANNNVLLRAPTGAGKTWSVLAPFLFDQWAKRPVRLIYALPLRTLAQGIYREAREAAAKLGHPIESQKDGRGREIVTPFVTLQTGEQPDDPFFDRGKIIVTTYDQLLSGVLNGPYGLSERLHNINSAILMGSLVVFDEFHLMESSQAFLTAAACLNLFREFSQSVWMTATATQPLENLLTDALLVKPVPADEKERDAMLYSLPSVTEVERKVLTENSPLSPKSVLDQGICRSLVLINTVDRAQTFFENLLQEMKLRNLTFPALLLHSRFFKEHRRDKEQQLRVLFGKGSKGPAILVATQVIEAGLDISSDHLHSELCPMNSLIQRAGRCARFAGEKGIVHVYPLPIDRQSWLPYGTLQAEDITLTKTRELLRFEGKKILDPKLAAEWVQCVHANQDQQELREGWRPRQNTCLGRIEQTAIVRDPKRISDLIRADNFQSIRVLVCDQARLPIKPGEREALTISRWSLTKLFKDGSPQPGWFWDGADDEPWKLLTGRAELQDVYVVCLRPVIAAYNKTMGLRLNKSGVEQSPDRTPPPRPGYASLRAEQWDRHALCVAAESARRLSLPKSGQDLLEEGFNRRYQIDWAAIEIAVRACSLLHDLGKLQEPWQRWAEAAQKNQDATYQHNTALAHTDFDREKPQKQLHVTRPPHAAASAYYGAAFLAEMLNPVCENRDVLASACAAAILGHHGGWLPGSMDLGIAKMWAGWEKPFAHATGLSSQSQMMTKLEAQRDKRGSAQQLLSLATGPNNIAKYWPLVAFLTRTLRLSDQRATADGASE